jgi:hypothetical protein
MGVGLKAGREILAKWKEEGRLPSGLVDDVKAKQATSRGTRLRQVTACGSSLDGLCLICLCHHQPDVDLNATLYDIHMSKNVPSLMHMHKYVGAPARPHEMSIYTPKTLRHGFVKTLTRSNAL